MEIEIPKLEMENHLREKRQAHALSQKQLADLAGITRQAISALESNQYSPATSVALQLARALQCRVEDLFSIKRGGEIIEGELLGPLPQSDGPMRAQVTQIGHRVLVRIGDREGQGSRPGGGGAAAGRRSGAGRGFTATATCRERPEDEDLQQGKTMRRATVHRVLE